MTRMNWRRVHVEDRQRRHSGGSLRVRPSKPVAHYSSTAPEAQSKPSTWKAPAVAPNAAHHEARVQPEGTFRLLLAITLIGFAFIALLGWLVRL